MLFIARTRGRCVRVLISRNAYDVSHEQHLLNYSCTHRLVAVQHQ
jgi:hypothetical protein